MRQPFVIVSLGLVGALAATSLDAAALELRVRDSATGAPIVAQLSLSGGGSTFAKNLDTDGNGAAAIELDSPEPFELRIAARGYTSIETYFAPDNGGFPPVTVWLDGVDAGVRQAFEDLGGAGQEVAIFDGFVRDANTGAGAQDAVVRLASGSEAAPVGADGYFRLAVAIPEPDAPFDKLRALPDPDDLIVERGGRRVYELREIDLTPGTTRYLIDLPPAGKAATIINAAHKMRIAARGIPFDSQILPAGAETESVEVAAPIGLLVVDPPATIRIGMTCSPCTTCSTVDVVSLETYVRRGLNDEWIASWAAHSLRSGAVAYRSYGTYYVNNPINVNYDICSTTCCQVNDTDTSAATNTAADAVSGFVLQRNNLVFRSEYSAENNGWDDPSDGLSCTNASLCGDGIAGSPGASWPCLSDTICLGRGCFGHGRGECQWGTQRWAASPQFKDWAWISNHYYNAGGVPGGMRSAYLTSPVRIDSASPNPAIVNAGGTFTVNVGATNLAELAHTQIMIGASLYSAATGTISDAANDTKVTLVPGANAVSRPFAVPAATPGGVYDLVVSLWFDINGDNAIDSADLSLTSFTNPLSVTVGNGTCGNPIVITAFPYTDNNSTLGRIPAIDGYSCPPSSGSEAGPETVYTFTITEPGNLTVTVSDGAGVDIDPHLLSVCAPGACLARNDTTFVAALQPGTYFLVCDTWTSSGGTQYPGAYTLNMSFASSAGDILAPAVVQNLRWTAASIRWDWNAVTTNRSGGSETISYYEVWRSTIATSPGTRIGTPATNYFADAATPVSGVWYYQIRAVDLAGNRDSPVLDAIRDNLDATFSGVWSTGTSTPGFWGTDYRFHSTGGAGAENATWTFTLDETGLYDVKVYYPAGANRSTAARFTVTRNGGSTLHTVNQQANGGAWNLLASHWFLAGSPYTITLDDAEPAGFVVIADAVRWTKP